jgi:TatD DNase family protein
VLVDTHCHLDAAEFDEDRDSVARAALASGVGRIVMPAVERANFGAVASLCRDYSGCAAAYGIHPMYVDRAREEDLDALREILQREQPLAVGEIGLDRHVEPRDDARQEFWFSAQLDMARERDLPVLLHVRRAIDPVLKYLRRARVPGGIAHAFNGSRQQADEFIKLGFKLGFRRRHELFLVPAAFANWRPRCPSMPSCWKPMRRTFRRPGSAASATARTNCRASPRCWQSCAALTAAEIAAATTANAHAVLPGLARLH